MNKEHYYAFPGDSVLERNRGMSLRTYFAGQALTGLLSNIEFINNKSFDDIAITAIQAAEKVIENLNKTEFKE